MGPFTVPAGAIRPALYFYDKEGNPIAAKSVVDVLGDLEVAEDGALSVTTTIEPLGVEWLRNRYFTQPRLGREAQLR